MAHFDKNFCRVSHLEYTDFMHFFRWGSGEDGERAGKRYRVEALVSVLGSKQNGVIVDGDVVRVFLATDTLPHAIAGDCIPRFHRQVSRCT